MGHKLSKQFLPAQVIVLGIYLFNLEKNVIDDLDSLPTGNEKQFSLLILKY